MGRRQAVEEERHNRPRGDEVQPEPEDDAVEEVDGEVPAVVALDLPLDLCRREGGGGTIQTEEATARGASATRWTLRGHSSGDSLRFVWSPL